MDNIVVTIIGIAGILFTYWFFFMKKSHTVTVSNYVDIVVEGGYSPSTIAIPVNKTITLNFIRKDPSPCLEEIVVPDFKIKKYLPLNEKTSINITTKKPGEYTMSCGMNMFHGKIIVT